MNPDGVRKRMPRKKEFGEPSLTELMEHMAAMDEVPIQEVAEAPATEAPPQSPPAEPATLPTVTNPNQPLRWEDWSINVKASAEDKEAVAREVIGKLKKGENHVMGARYDCVMYGCRTQEGIFLYDCVAKKRATLK